VVIDVRARAGLLRGCARGVFVLFALVSACAAAREASSEWPTYGHDPGGMRYSPLTQIDPSNVSRLQIAWTYAMRPAAPSQPPLAAAASEGDGLPARGRSRFGASQATPLVIEGVMYLSTPYRRVVALEPETGRELWVYDVPGPGQPSLRGVEFWPGDATHAPRIFFGTRDGRLIGLDARSGLPASGFGQLGVVDLKTPDVAAAAAADSPRAQYGMTSPPLVYRNLVITGSATQEFPAQGASGDVRAWDARTGEHVWTFHTVPRPGELGHDTWREESWRNRSGVNVWGFMTVDVERGILYMPVAAPAWDRYGGDRPGDNLFSSSIVAVDAATGKRLWHFQVVHHDIWDLDTQAPPVLLEVGHRGRRIPAVAIVSKSGFLFLLDRRSGRPLFKVIERRVPTSDAPGEQASRTQPVPVKPPPFARQSFSLSEVATVTPELETHCRDWIEKHRMRTGGLYEPIGFHAPTISFPGRQGGANWGGGSFDPTRSLFFVNASNLGQVEQLARREDGSLTISGPATGRFSDREKKLMCQQPPWGTLTAIDLRSGEITWQSTLGVSDGLPAGRERTGRPNVGGSIATAGGLVFIGATDDARFRAFHAETGEELWTAKLEASAHATPITYLGKDGRQYVAIVATGGSFLDSPVQSDRLNVYALPVPPDPYAGRKKILIVGDTRTGNQIAHDAVSHAMATLERLGRDSGAYVAFLRTDTELVTKGEVWGQGDYAKGGPRQARGRNLDYFDAVVFYTNGETEMTAVQKRDLLAFVRDDGKGFVAVHTATASFYSWPEYGELVGGYFDNHPWNVFEAPIVVERPEFPAMQHLPREFTLRDEMYQYRAPYSREAVDVLARLDQRKLDLANKNVRRTDGDFPVAWIKSYGKGRVFSSTLGHPDAVWDDPRVQTMYLEAIKWVLRLTEGSPEPHPQR
jgi:quinoprotein glucose dehydrogenase